MENQADMNGKKYFKCFELFYKTGKNLPDEIKVKYYDALMEYGLYGVEPSDPVILSLLQGAMYSIDKFSSQRKKTSKKMEGNSNAVKTFEKALKQIETDTNSGKQFLSDGSIEEIEEKENKKKRKKKTDLVSVDDLVEAYKGDPKLVEEINDESVVRERAEWKQTKAKGGYKTTRGFVSELRAIVGRVLFGMPMRGDIAKRIRYGMDKAIDREKPRESIYRTEEMEKDYQHNKQYNLDSNKNTDERFP